MGGAGAGGVKKFSEKFCVRSGEKTIVCDFRVEK